MENFHRTAYYLLAWKAWLTTLISAALTTSSMPELKPALLIAAHVALLFSLFLMVTAGRLTSARVVRAEAWRALDARERPAGEAGRRWARNDLRELQLRFARAAAAVAIVFAGLALAI